MPTDGRAQSVSVPDEAGATMPHQDDMRAAGQAYGPWNTGRPGDTRLKKPVAKEDREALKRLVEAGRMIRRGDGRYGTTAKPLITNVVAARLKARELAVSGFDKQKTMYPSDKGRRLYAEMKSNASIFSAGSKET
jgi:hypothetical protein